VKFQTRREKMWRRSYTNILSSDEYRKIWTAFLRKAVERD
jgi:hypothetical protein